MKYRYSYSAMNLFKSCRVMTTCINYSQCIYKYIIVLDYTYQVLTVHIFVYAMWVLDCTHCARLFQGKHSDSADEAAEEVLTVHIQVLHHCTRLRVSSTHSAYTSKTSLNSNTIASTKYSQCTYKYYITVLEFNLIHFMSVSAQCWLYRRLVTDLSLEICLMFIS